MGAISKRGASALWVALLTAASTATTLALACATPFPSLAALAAVHMRQRDGVALMLLAWLASQGVGFFAGPGGSGTFGVSGTPRARDARIRRLPPPGGNGMKREHSALLAKILSRTAMTEAMLRLRLHRQGLCGDEADSLVRDAHDLGMVDDEAYARLFVEGHQSWGNRRIRDDLRRRGVSDHFPGAIAPGNSTIRPLP